MAFPLIIPEWEDADAVAAFIPMDIPATMGAGIDVVFETGWDALQYLPAALAPVDVLGVPVFILFYKTFVALLALRFHPMMVRVIPI